MHLCRMCAQTLGFRHAHLGPSHHAQKRYPEESSMFHPDSTSPARPLTVPSRTGLLSIVAAIAGLVLSITIAHPGAADQKMIERGKYLVTLGGYMDCHSPGYFFGKPDMARYLGGSEVGFEIPGLGVFHG